MASNEIMGLLRASDYFGGLSEPVLRAIARLCSTQTLRKDEILFVEGMPGEKIYLLSSGTLQLFKEAPGGRRSLIHLVRAGDLFAEVVLFERESYPVTAVASERSRVIGIPKAEFLALLEEKKAREDFIRLLMKKLRLLTQHIRRLTSEDLEERFFGFLEDHFGREAVIQPKMSKKDMAAAMGVTPEAFSRFLARMRKSGRVSWEKGEIRRALGPRRG